MAKENYPIEEVKDLVNQLVRITEVLIDPPSSLDSSTINDLKLAQYETIQNLSCITD